MDDIWKYFRQSYDFEVYSTATFELDPSKILKHENLVVEDIWFRRLEVEIRRYVELWIKQRNQSINIICDSCA